MPRARSDVIAAIDAAARRALGTDERIVASTVGVRRGALHHGPRGLVVTDRRALVVGRGAKAAWAVVADCPRYAAEVTEQRGDRLTVELAGTPFTVWVPESERTRAAGVARALAPDAAPDEQLVASLGSVDLPRALRRTLGIGPHERAALVVTDRDVVVLARRDGHWEVALRCPRQAVRVLDHETVWPGGELLFERLVLAAPDATVRLNLDGRMYERARAVVAALGGVSKSMFNTREANL
jgi:hypothetical protein